MNLKEHSHYLSEEERSFIVFLNKEGFSYEQIKDKVQATFGRTIYNSTISNILNKYRSQETVADREKPGRPIIYDEREQRSLVRSFQKLNTTSMRELQRNTDLNPKGASRQTLDRILLSHEVHTIVIPKRLDDLTKKCVRDRRLFGKVNSQSEEDDWKGGVFSDESDLFPAKSGKKFLRLKEGQHLVDVVPIREEVKKILTIKVWGAISYSGTGPLVRYEDTMKAQKYIEILETHLLQTYPELRNQEVGEEDSNMEISGFFFIDDNASSHTAKIVKSWKKKNGIKTPRWPSHSPDINIIENVWAYLKNELFKIEGKLSCPDDTWEETVKLWNGLDTNFIRNLYHSLPNRMNELQRMKGGPINY